MRERTKAFELLSYLGLALGVLCTFWRFNFPKDELVVVAPQFFVVAALIWLAGRKAQTWAAWILVLWLVLTSVVVFHLFAGQRVPDVLSILRPYGRPPALYLIVEAIGVVLSAVGLSIYFFGKRT